MPDPFDPLPREFYLRDPRAVARDLLGRFLALRNPGNRGSSGALVRIVETEAYLGDDPASHSFIGPTARNASMFLEGGHAYVYRIYGIHRCLNAVTGARDVGEAVLIRAAEPLEGIDAMWERRYGETLPEGMPRAPESGRKPDRRLKGLCSGPGNLCRALGIGVSGYDGADLTAGPLAILSGNPVEESAAERSPRIGLAPGKGDAYPWRWYIRENPFVSRSRRGRGSAIGSRTAIGKESTGQ